MKKIYFNDEISVEIYNKDNMAFNTEGINADLVFADCVYESLDFNWIDKYWGTLRDGGIFILMTDWHTVFEAGYYLKYNIGGNHLNHICWKNEFGNFPKNKFRQSHDDILIFSKGEDYKFYPDRVQVPKATAKSKGLNKSGRITKLATSVWNDICLTTVAKERIKKPDGRGIRWQKPIRLIERAILPYTDEGDLILDPFMGSGTVGDWCVQNKRSYIGLEYDNLPYSLSEKRIFDRIKEVYE